MLRLVREDSKPVVLTVHPDHIHPRDLSNQLECTLGKISVRIYLMRSIYVI
jgi:hypothetical protein